MTDRLDADAVARVLRRAHEIETRRGLGIDPALDPGGVSPDALLAAAGDVGIDPAAVREALAVERFGDDPQPNGRLDRVVGAPDVSVQRTLPHSVDDTLDAIQEWLTTGHQMRGIRTGDNTVECRPRTGLGASLGRAVTEFTDDESMHPLDRVVVQAYEQHHDPPTSIVRITAVRRSTRAHRLGGGAAGGLAGIGTAVVGIVEPSVWWPLASVAFVGGGLLVALSGNKHADRVEVELVRIIGSVARSERPTGIAGRAVRTVREAIRTVRSKDR